MSVMFSAVGDPGFDFVEARNLVVCQVLMPLATTAPFCEPQTNFASYNDNDNY